MDGYTIIETIKTGLLIMQFGIMPLVILTMALFVSGLVNLKTNN